MSEVFMAERGQLDERSKRDLRKAGITVVEVEDLTRATFVRATQTVSADDMLWAAMNALKERDSYEKGKDMREQLAHNLISITDAAFARRRQATS